MELILSAPTTMTLECVRWHELASGPQGKQESAARRAQVEAPSIARTGLVAGELSG